MLIHRSNAYPEPYRVTFENDTDTHFYEHVVARNATMLSPYDMEVIGMDIEEACTWAELGFTFIVRNNGDFASDHAHFNIERLRRFGSLLGYFADTTRDELHRIANNNPPTKEVFGARLYEGKMAQVMHDTIASRIKVPKLLQPNKRKIVGF